MTPPQTQFRQDVSLRLGAKADITVGEPGVQGAGVLGTQGIGVSTPIAADVAEAVAGKPRELQTPKGGILTSGL